VSIAAGGNFIAVLRMYSERARQRQRQRQQASREAAAHAAPADPRQEATIP